MPNIASALKEEITRVARKAIKSETDLLKKQVSHYRSEIAALKRRLQAVEKQGKRVAKTVSRAVPKEPDEELGTKLRFRADGFAKKRQTLGLSAAQVGALIGVSGQTIYHWEAGKAKPRVSQMPAIAAFRKLGKRTAAERLTEAKLR